MESPKPDLSQQVFGTSEGILAFCLYLAGAEWADPRQPCFNLYDPEILSGLGYKGEKLWNAAQEAWKVKARGHVEYSFKLTQRTHDLIQVYRELREEIKKQEGDEERASDHVLGVVERLAKGEILPDEAILRIACVNLTVRGSFMNLWKEVVPLLRIPNKGKATTSETTVRGNDGKMRPAIRVSKPGYKTISLNATPETRKKLGL